jgi:hypothetical protein
MLTARVGLSRKLTKDYNSRGFSIDLEGEIPIDRNDAEAVVDSIQELYDLTEEALQRQIQRYESDSAIASHDDPATAPPIPPPPKQETSPAPKSSSGNGAPRNRIKDGELAATNKQIQYLLTLGKRMKLSKPKLEKRIEQVLGESGVSIDIYDLSKREAGIVINTLTDKQPATSNGR